MPRFHSFISDVELEKEFIENLKNRKLEQKFAYLGFGAKNYYNAVTGNAYDPLTIDYFGFLKKIIKKTEKIALISLGCGNGHQEKKLLEKLTDEGYNFYYFGVDSSKEMLELAEKKLDNVAINRKKFICADFTVNYFKEEIDNLTRHFDMKIFAFLGGSFANPNQTNITDSLYNILGKNDMLWIDVKGRSGDSKKTELDIFQKNVDILNDEKHMRFQFSPLESIGIPFENGVIKLEAITEDSVGALLFKFYFKFIKKTVVPFRNETLHFIPNQKIELINRRNYNVKMLIEFFELYDFKITQKEELDEGGGIRQVQLMLKRKN